MNFGSESIFKVEARAMLEGLFLAWDKDFKKFEVENDNASLVEGVNSRLVEVCLLHPMLRRDWEIRVRHVSRNANDVADTMAKHMTIRDSMLQLFQEPPTVVNRFLQKDNYVACVIST